MRPRKKLRKIENLEAEEFHEGQSNRRDKLRTDLAPGNPSPAARLLQEFQLQPSPTRREGDPRHAQSCIFVNREMSMQRIASPSPLVGEGCRVRDCILL